MKRHTKSDPCIVCGGNPTAIRGQGVRCSGWVSDDGEWAHCSREDFANGAKFHSGSVTYSHRATGKCACGEVHAPETAEDRERHNDRRLARAPAPRAQVHQIGESALAPVVATYDYCALDGSLLYQVCRTEPKSFRQRRPCPDHPGDDNRRDARCVTSGCRDGWIWNMQGRATTLFRIPELFAALAAGDTVWVVEGEKDVLALFEAGAVATCNTGGAGKWRAEFGEPFRGAQPGARVAIVQDDDDPGKKHARSVFESVSAAVPAGVECLIFAPAVGKDAADHLAAGRGLDAFVQVWPPPEDLLDRDPAGFKRFMLQQALELPVSALARIPIVHARERHPLIPVGLLPPSQMLRTLIGATVLSGAPSAGKSYLAISSAVDAALLGWDVFYCSCEMHEDLIFDRAARAAASHAADELRLTDNWYRAELIARARTIVLPDSFHYLNVGIGVKMDDVLAYLVDHGTARPAFVVFDSLSSFVDQLVEERGSDAFRMADLREVVRWVVASRRMTHGQVSFLLLSELNKEGRAKGRFVDHRCDVALALESDKENGSLKRLTVTKSWWGPTGKVGEFVLDWELGRLRRVSV